MVAEELTEKADVIVYAENGDRSSDGSALLARLEVLLPWLGITRVGEVSQLAPNGFPVCQSTRPNLLHHVSYGMNTGSQGKGPSRLQAQLSCMMEAVEGYCAEPRNVAFIRSSRSVNLPEMSRAPLVKVFYGQRDLVAIATRVAGTLFHAGIVFTGTE